MDLKKECDRYEGLLNNSEIDLQILGVGRNGHIAFNEPYTSFLEGVHTVLLTNDTIAANARFFDNLNKVPTQALTMGIKNILKSKKIILLAVGTSKSEAMYRFFNENINAGLPISALKNHDDITIIMDYESSSKLFKHLNE